MMQAIDMSPRQNASPDLAFPHPNVLDIRRLRVHRLVTRQIGADKYLVGRAGARGAISTSALGVFAIGLLRRGMAPREVEAALDRTTKTTVDLSTLLSALMRAGFITRADSLCFTTPRVSLLAEIRARARSRLNPLQSLTDFLAGSVPPALALGPLRLVRRRALSASGPFNASELARRMSAGSSTPHPDIVKDHQHELADQDALTRLIIQAKPKHLDSWLRNHVTLIGMEHVLNSAAAGRGTIVAAYHCGAFPLIPVSMAANGVSISMPHFGVHFGATPHERVFDAHVEACGWAPVEVHREGSLRTIARIVRTLRGGGVACISVDYCNPRPSADRRSANDPVRRQTQLGVTIAGRSVMVENWVGWLAGATNSRVIPAVARRMTRHDYTVELRPALPLEAAGDRSSREYAASITRLVVATLEPDVSADPARWAFLTTFTPADSMQL